MIFTGRTFLAPFGFSSTRGGTPETCYTLRERAASTPLGTERESQVKCSDKVDIPVQKDVQTMVPLLKETESYEKGRGEGDFSREGTSQGNGQTESIGNSALAPASCLVSSIRIPQEEM